MPSLAGILAERLLQCKVSPAEKVNDFGPTKVGLLRGAVAQRPSPRVRGEGRDEGDSPRVMLAEGPPHPKPSLCKGFDVSRTAAASGGLCSPRKRGEVTELTRRSGILDDRAEQLPALAVELHHLHLLVDAIVVRPRRARHAVQRQAGDQVRQAGRVPPQVFAGE